MFINLLQFFLFRSFCGLIMAKKSLHIILVLIIFFLLRKIYVFYLDVHKDFNEIYLICILSSESNAM